MALCLRIVFLLGFLLNGWNSRAAPSQPTLQAQQGVLDVSSWDFEKASLPLRGQWMFYWKRLFTVDEIKAEAFLKEKSFLIPSPSGSWASLGNGIEAKGWATYILQIKGLSTLR